MVSLCMEIAQAQYECSGQREPDEPAATEHAAVCAGARLEVARAAEAVRQWAHDLHAHEPLGQERGCSTRCLKSCSWADSQCSRRAVRARFDLGQGSP